MKIIDVPKEFKSYPAQVIYFLLAPIFFLSFVLIYQPFDINDFFDADRGRFVFNIIMVTLILMASLALTRTLFYILRNVMKTNWTLYIIWCIGDVLVAAHFMILYSYLIYRGELNYFYVVSNCFKYSFLILIYPYAIISMAINMIAKSAQKDKDSTNIRFFDEYKKQKLVLAADALLYIEADENYVKIKYKDVDKLREYQLRNSMKSLEYLTDKYGIIRCQRSFYVNPIHVKALRKDKDGFIYAELDMEGLRDIPVSKRYFDTLAKLL